MKGKSLGFYWGIRADAAGAEGAASLPPGVSIQHLQKVAGETRSQGKLSSGFYFSQARPASALLRRGLMREAQSCCLVSCFQASTTCKDAQTSVFLRQHGCAA